ncbi:hypothetical protein H6G98_00955 [Nostoc sp. FACHB-857]|nr:hypothetical protein [Nostoc sp. FACHB-857]
MTQLKSKFIAGIRDEGDEGDAGTRGRGEKLMPNAQCPMPHAPCPMPLTLRQRSNIGSITSTI